MSAISCCWALRNHNSNERLRNISFLLRTGKRVSLNRPAESSLISSDHHQQQQQPPQNDLCLTICMRRCRRCCVALNKNYSCRVPTPFLMAPSSSIRYRYRHMCYYYHPPLAKTHSWIDPRRISREIDTIIRAST